MEQQEALLAEGPPSPPSPRPPTPCLPPTEDADDSRVGAVEGDSSSAGSDVALGPADPVSAQLINNITMLDYRSLGNTSPLIHEEDSSKCEGLAGVSSGQLPHFVSWNWALIRDILFFGVLSALLCCLAAVVALVATLPSTCNPELPWYQGSLFYEVFPASFQDSNGDGIGDIKGLTSRLDYIQGLGVRVVRLNSIFRAESYPEGYKNVTSLVDIDKSLGTLRDLSLLITSLHSRNMSIILDLPIYPYITRLEKSAESVSDIGDKDYFEKNNSKKFPDRPVQIHNEDQITTAIRYWVSNGVDGFYLKGLEHLIDDLYFSETMNLWKKIIGTDRIFIVNYEALQRAEFPAFNTLMYKADLVDVFLNVGNGTDHIKQQVDSVLRGPLWSKAGSPWAHWSVGSVDSRRLSSVMGRQTLPALLLNLMLPGTPSLFYGDEIGLQEISEPEGDFHESKHIHNLMVMEWPTGERGFTVRGVLPWAKGGGVDEDPPRALSELAVLRPTAPPLYLNAVWKEGIGLPNAQVRYAGSILVVERWYPRRNSFVLVANTGTANATADLSSWFYGGIAAVATDQRLQGQQVVFRSLALRPAEALLIRLDK